MITGWRQVATTDLDLISRWWRAWPLANIGLLMGGVLRLIAIDIDGDEGRESLAKLESEHGILPPTLTQVTGRAGGGEHRLVRVPDNLEIDYIRNRVRIAPGIDIRAEGGLIVAAPSMHPTGMQYRWLAEGTPVGELPEWFYKLAVSLRERQKVVSVHGDRPSEDDLPSLDLRLRRATLYLATMSPAIQGQNGSLACLKAAIALVRGFCLSPENAFELLWQDYNPRCVPLWTEHELMHKIEAAELVVDVEWGSRLKAAERTQYDNHYDGLRQQAERLEEQGALSKTKGKKAKGGKNGKKAGGTNGNGNGDSNGNGNGNGDGDGNGGSTNGGAASAKALWDADAISAPKPVGDKVVAASLWEL
jgi:hypothetical protein